MFQAPRAVDVDPHEDEQQMDEILGLSLGSDPHVAHAIDERDRRVDPNAHVMRDDALVLVKACGDAGEVLLLRLRDRGGVRGKHDRHTAGGEDSVSRRGACLALLLLLETGCGYHAAGHSVQLPENVKTIAIPAFVNETNSYRIEQTLTASVVREFTTRTHYHLINAASETADATLRGTVGKLASAPQVVPCQCPASIFLSDFANLPPIGVRDSLLRFHSA